MTTPFSLNPYFDEDFINFEYNEFEALSFIDEEMEREMDELNLVEAILLPYRERSESASPEQVQTPNCTPCTPIEHEEEITEDDDMVDLAMFTDVCLNSVLRPIPEYFQDSQRNKGEGSYPAQRQ
jgi:hypothetical protein